MAQFAAGLVQAYMFAAAAVGASVPFGASCSRPPSRTSVRRDADRAHLGKSSMDDGDPRDPKHPRPRDPTQYWHDGKSEILLALPDIFGVVLGRRRQVQSGGETRSDRPRRVRGVDRARPRPGWSGAVVVWASKARNLLGSLRTWIAPAPSKLITPVETADEARTGRPVGTYVSETSYISPLPPATAGDTVHDTCEKLSGPELIVSVSPHF